MRVPAYAVRLPKFSRQKKVTSPNMKSPGGLLITATIALVLLAATAPLLIELSRALLPLVVVAGVVVVAIRLVFFHTKGW